MTDFDQKILTLLNSCLVNERCFFFIDSQQFKRKPEVYGRIPMLNIKTQIFFSQYSGKGIVDILYHLPNALDGKPSRLKIGVSFLCAQNSNLLLTYYV